jgi:hypothetical protein
MATRISRTERHMPPKDTLIEGTLDGGAGGRGVVGIRTFP